MRAFFMIACLSSFLLAGCGEDKPKAATDVPAPTKEATASETAPKAPDAGDKKE
jgi:hypothetical protein